MPASIGGFTGSDISMLTRGRGLSVNVELLDGTVIDLPVERKSKGADLLDKVCDDLQLLEKDYFGLQRRDGLARTWVDLNRRLSKTFKNDPWEVRLAVKFYPPEPSELKEDITRYYLKMAVRRELMEGNLHCSEVTHALLASYLLQSELGDYEDTQIRRSALSDYALVPSQLLTRSMGEMIIELYEKHGGQTPAEAELNYLESAKKLAMYGVDLHPAKDSQGVDITLGVCASGLLVHRENLILNRFPWSKVLKLSYRSKVFTVRLRAGDCEEYEMQVGFKCAKSAAAKKLWRSAVEHHMFFRRVSPVQVPRIPLFPRLGSRRTSCRSTLHQLRCSQTVRHQQPMLTRNLLVR